MDEINQAPKSETQPDAESAIQESLKKRQEQFEAPNPKTVMDKVDALTHSSREFAKKFADNKIVKYIPIVSPLVEASLDLQKSTTAALYGKDVDTGAKLSGKERANVAVSHFGKFLWEKTAGDIQIATVVASGSLVEKVIGKLLNKTVSGVEKVRAANAPVENKPLPVSPK